MKRIIAVLFVVSLAFTMISGCATLESDYSKVEAKLKAVDWDKALTYWKDFDKGLNVALNLAETADPKAKPVIDGVVKPILAKADDSVSALAGTIQAVKSGTADEASITNAVARVRDDVVAANAVVGQIAKVQSAGPQVLGRVIGQGSGGRG